MVNPDDVLTTKIIRELGESRFHILRLEATLEALNARLAEAEAKPAVQDAN